MKYNSVIFNTSLFRIHQGAAERHDKSQLKGDRRRLVTSLAASWSVQAAPWYWYCMGHTGGDANHAARRASAAPAGDPSGQHYHSHSESTATRASTSKHEHLQPAIEAGAVGSPRHKSVLGSTSRPGGVLGQSAKAAPQGHGTHTHCEGGMSARPHHVPLQPAGICVSFEYKSLGPGSKARPKRAQHPRKPRGDTSARRHRAHSRHAVLCVGEGAHGVWGGVNGPRRKGAAPTQTAR